MDEFIQLTPTIAEHIVRAIEWSRGLPRISRRAALLKRASRDDRAFDAHAFDLLDDAVPAFHGLPHVGVFR